ncbi:hypothetical protein TNCV_2194801 [Trichonephila clavipes]|uniref:Uncharacterized protein n=1 Tax=Trichonephila clavipes TaxID=2585209 RepID=A0A8X6VKJ6_TRICX|nr:hypothetical protein TNCV_2194801 [Trichonephila clavipes]
MRAAIKILHRVAALLFPEIASRVKQDISSSWRKIPVHEWYEGNHPGTALLGTGSRLDETVLARLRSEHNRAQQHMMGLKVYPTLSELQCDTSRSCPRLGLHWLP